jgi:hypothetical protein
MYHAPLTRRSPSLLHSKPEPAGYDCKGLSCNHMAAEIVTPGVQFCSNTLPNSNSRVYRGWHYLYIRVLLLSFKIVISTQKVCFSFHSWCTTFSHINRYLFKCRGKPYIFNHYWWECYRAYTWFGRVRHKARHTHQSNSFSARWTINIDRMCKISYLDYANEETIWSLLCIYVISSYECLNRSPRQWFFKIAKKSLESTSKEMKRKANRHKSMSPRSRDTCNSSCTTPANTMNCIKSCYNVVTKYD